MKKVCFIFTLMVETIFSTHSMAAYNCEDMGDDIMNCTDPESGAIYTFADPWNSNTIDCSGTTCVRGTIDYNEDTGELFFIVNSKAEINPEQPNIAKIINYNGDSIISEETVTFATNISDYGYFKGIDLDNDDWNHNSCG